MGKAGSVVVVSVDALSYSGTTWLNLVLGSHAKAFTLGPPHRVWRLKDDGFRGANLVWGAQDTFWSGFGKRWDRSENFLLALARYRDCSHIVFDNPGDDFRRNVISQPGIVEKRMWYLRDARAITASFARKHPDKTYLETILPSGWFYHSFTGIALPRDRTAHPVFYYEKCLTDPVQFLKEVGPFLGLTYDATALRFWDWDHHITSGNQGSIALVKMAKGIDVGSFKDRDFYAERLQSLQRDPLTGFVDDRWKDQLGRLERFYFDVLLGEKHTELGYTRDVFGDDEIQALIGEHAARVAVKQEFDFPPGSIDAYLAKRHGSSLGEPIIATMQLGGRGARFRRIARRSVKAMLRMFKPGEERLTPGEIARAVHRKMTYRFSPPAPLRPPQDFTSPLPGIPVPDSGTFYFDEVPQELSSQISPYIVRCGQSTRATIKSILRPSHYNLFEAYGPDYAGKGCHRIVADPPQRYRELLKGLLAIQGTRFMMARDLVNYRPSKSEIVCHVRHDVDGDIDSALQQAGIEASLGIQTTYYILHTAPYYGDWDGAIFERHEAMAKVYKKIQGLGHEVALHTDGLGLYRFQKTDGAAGVKAELAWLRSNGLKITGTAGHNSAGVYGAENFALFKGRPLSTLAPAGPIAVIHNGRGGLLQQLDEKSLGLDYEANDIFLQKEVPIQYFALRGANDWRHQVYNPDKIPDLAEQLWNRSQWYSQEEVIDCLAAGPRNVYAIFAVHPEFYGLRSAHDASAVMNCEAPAKQNLTSLGWRGFAANEISQRYERAADKSDRQSVVKINELGFADVPPAYIAGCARRFVFLGKDNIATDFTSVECKLPQAFIREIRRKDAMLWGATALAGKLTPIAVRIAWLSRLLETEKIDDVILSVGLSDLITEDRDQLMSIWGLTRDQAALLLPDELSPQALHAITASTFVGSSTPKIDSAGRILVDEIVNGGKERGPPISRRLNTALTLLQSFGLRTTLLVEDCGENMGLSWIAASQSERVRRVVTAQAVFEPVAQSNGISLVNPYQAFLDYQGLAPSHWPTDGQWAIHAHTLAAHALRRTTLLATTGAK